MCHRVGVEQAVERGVEVILGAVCQQAVDDFGQASFPEGVLQLAAGLGNAGGQPRASSVASAEMRLREENRVRFMRVLRGTMRDYTKATCCTWSARIAAVSRFRTSR